MMASVDQGLIDLLPSVDELSLSFLDEQEPTCIVKRQRKRTNPKSVLEALRREESRLRKQLEFLRAQNAKRLVHNNFGWQRVAINQKALKIKALRENQELRAMLAEHTLLQQYMEKALLKRPQTLMTKLEDQKWRLFSLGANPVERIAAMHAIADREYERVETEMIAHGLCAPVFDVLDVHINKGNVQEFTAQVARYTVLNGSLESIFHGTQDVLKNRHFILEHDMPKQFRLLVNNTRELSDIDANTWYCRENISHVSGHLQISSNVILKAYKSSSRACIIWRSVLDDQIYPHESKSFVNNEHGWIYLEPKGDNLVHFKFYLHSSAPIPPPCYTLDDFNQFLRLCDPEIAIGSQNELLDSVAAVTTKAVARKIAMVEQEIQKRALFA